jgi:hypothetical protein
MKKKILGQTTVEYMLLLSVAAGIAFTGGRMVRDRLLGPNPKKACEGGQGKESFICRFENVLKPTEFRNFTIRH